MIHTSSWTLTPQAGFRLTQATLGGVNEVGSELALNVDSITQTLPTCLADLEIALDPAPLARLDRDACGGPGL